MQNTETTEDTIPLTTAEYPAVVNQLNALDREPAVEHVPSQFERPVVNQQQPLAHAYIVPPKGSSHKNIIAGSIAAFIVIVAVGGGSAFWYFGIRTPDIEYEKASAIVDSMMSNAKGLADIGTTLQNGPATTSTLTSIKLADTKSDTKSILNSIDEAAMKASEYANSLTNLTSSTVITKDPSVQAVYSANTKVINEYGSSSETMYKTAYIYYTLLDRCFGSTTVIPSDSVKTADDYDSQVKLCKDYTESEKTVPIKDFNDNFYVQYRAFLLSYIANVRSLYTETAGSKAWYQAYQNMLTATKDFLKVDTSKVKAITNSQNPQDQLGKLKSKIDERKKVFFR